MGSFLGAGLQGLFATLFEIWTYMATAVAAGVSAFIWGWARGRKQGKEQGTSLEQWRQTQRAMRAKQARDDAQRYGDPHIDPTGMLRLRTPRPRSMGRAPFSDRVYPVEPEFEIHPDELDDPRGEHGHRHRHHHRE